MSIFESALAQNGQLFAAQNQTALMTASPITELNISFPYIIVQTNFVLRILDTPLHHSSLKSLIKHSLPVSQRFR